jgi:hypothetical protein
VPARPISSGRHIAFAAVLDALFVLLFVVIGRRSHGETLALSGIWTTYWPFLTALVLGWMVALAWREPTRVQWPGVPVWLVTVAGGMALRAVSMQGVALSFVIVATVVLGIFLLGWRVLVRWALRSRGKRAHAAR